MKSKEKSQAISLRKQGKSYNEISRLLLVSKGTLSRWLENVELTREQERLLSERSRVQGIAGGESRRKTWDDMRDAIKKSYHPPLDVPFFQLGLGLYWGEGDKYSRSGVGMSNSDPRILWNFKCWIEKFFADDYESFRLQIHHHYPDRDEVIKDVWSKWLEIADVFFCKSYFKPSMSSKMKRGNTLPYGVARLRVAGNGVWKIRQKIEVSFGLIVGPLV